MSGTSSDPSTTARVPVPYLLYLGSCRTKGASPKGKLTLAARQNSTNQQMNASSASSGSGLQLAIAGFDCNTPTGIVARNFAHKFDMLLGLATTGCNGGNEFKRHLTLKKNRRKRMENGLGDSARGRTDGLTDWMIRKVIIYNWSRVMSRFWQQALGSTKGLPAIQASF